MERTEPVPELQTQPHSKCHLYLQDFPFEQYAKICRVCRAHSGGQILCLGANHPRKADQEGFRFDLESVCDVEFALRHYMQTGRALRKDVSKIEKRILTMMHTGRDDPITMFGYVEGSSGLGKTQLAFALQIPVLYIPFVGANEQNIYTCFSSVFQVVQSAVQHDVYKLRLQAAGALSEDAVFSTTNISTSAIHFQTVSVLIRLLRLLKGQLAESADLFIFCGANVHDTCTLMTIHEGKDIIKNENLQEYLIFIDEVPSKSREYDFWLCLFLRNLIRCLRGYCILSGTESALMNMFSSAIASRSNAKRPWLELICDVPPTDLSIWVSDFDSKLTPYELCLLSNTRPLFVEYFKACVDHESLVDMSAQTPLPAFVALTPRVLSEMKRCICIRKPNFMSLEGLHGQFCLLFASNFIKAGPMTVDDYEDDDADTAVGSTSGHKRKRTGFAESSCGVATSASLEESTRWVHSLLIRNHFALLDTPPKCHRIMNNYGKLCFHVEPSVPFKVSSKFAQCADDTLLYLVCMRAGLFYDDRQVSASFAFASFRTNTTFVNVRAASNLGKYFEQECLAAAVLASHRYTSFEGTPFFTWLKQLIAELYPEEEFPALADIEAPRHLFDSLKDKLIGILSPVNCDWEQPEAPINLGTCRWCANNEQSDGLLTSRDFAVTLEMKDHDNPFGGEKFASVVNKFARMSSHVCILFTRNLATLQPQTFERCADNVALYEMRDAAEIHRFENDLRMDSCGNKFLIAIDIMAMHGDRASNRI